MGVRVSVADIRRCCHTTIMVTIYMPLLNEGVDVWRPVEATQLSADRYRVKGNRPADEEWAFPPGAIVRCERTTFKEGGSELTVVGLAG